MKRYITLMLASALVLSAVSCGSDSKGNDETTTSDAGTTAADETTAPEETDGLPEKDMDGFELRINHFDGTWLSWALTTLDVESETGDRLDDAIYRRNRDMEDRFNCKISVTGQKTIENKDIQTEVMAGDSNYDVWFMYDIWTLGSIEYLMPWEELPYVNLDKEWWNPMATGVFELGGKTYAAAGNYSLSVLSRASGFAFNKTVFEQSNPDEDVYSLARDGKWTVDKMASFAKNAYSDLNGNSEMDDDDRYGISGSWKETMNRLMLGSGIQYISKDENDLPVFKLPTDENSINKILHIFDLVSDGQVYRNTGKVMDTTGDGLVESYFEGGKVMFYAANMFSLEQMRDFDIEMGFLPCPKYDEAQETYYAPSFGSEISVLLKTLPEDRKENVGILLEALAYDTNKSIIPEYKEVLLKTKYARDNESEEMIDIIVNSVSFEFGLNAWQSEVANPLVQKIFVSRKGDVASTLAAMQKSVDTQIEKLVEKLEQ